MEGMPLAVGLRDSTSHSTRMHLLISALSRFTQPTGICRHAANLARCLSDVPQVGRITLLVGQWQEGYFRRAFCMASRKIEVVPIHIANNSLARNRWFATDLPKVAKSYRPDIVHLGFPVPVFRSTFTCPVVASVHDLYPYDFPESFSRFNGFWKRRFFRRCMQACDAVACVSEMTRGSLERHFPGLRSRVPVQLVHNYADFPLGPGEAPPVDADPRPFLLTVAQHQPNKRLDLLLRAFHRLRSENLVDRELQLLMVGSPGSQTNLLRELATSLGLDSQVQWVPPVSDSQLAWLYQNCEAFLTSSCIEGFCLPLLEALYFNCRVVASDIPVFREFAGGNGIFFDLSSAGVENLAAHIQRALASPLRASRPALPFSRTTTAAECLSLYSQVLPKMALPASAVEPGAHDSARTVGQV